MSSPMFPVPHLTKPLMSCPEVDFALVETHFNSFTGVKKAHGERYRKRFRSHEMDMSCPTMPVSDKRTVSPANPRKLLSFPHRKRRKDAGRGGTRGTSTHFFRVTRVSAHAR